MRCYYNMVHKMHIEQFSSVPDLLGDLFVSFRWLIIS